MRLAAAFSLACVAAAMASPAAARAEFLRRLDGDARVLGESSFAEPGATGAYFVLESAGANLDLRSNPGSLLLITPAGVLFAEADASTRRFDRWRFDAESGRPLRHDAIASAVCATGTEAPCWRPGDPVPYSEEVAAALSIQPVPLSPLIGDRVGVPSAADTTLGFSLSDSQQALLGCGPFWDRDCREDGIDLRYAASSVLLQAWRPASLPAPGTTTPGWIPGGPGSLPCVARAVGFCRTTISPSRTLTNPLNPQTFTNELAAVSWNFQMLLVAFSEAPSAQPSGDGDFDPFDSMSDAPNQCSLRQPQYCSTVRDLYDLTTTPEPPNGDPDGAVERWIWESGAEYRVVEALGDVRGYAGGRIHVLGVESSRTRAATTGIPIALFPAANTTLAPDAPFAIPPSDTATTATFGFAYLSAPEPSDAALGVVAIAALRLLARPRHRAPRAKQPSEIAIPPPA
jgi:hypothetical protein